MKPQTLHIRTDRGSQVRKIARQRVGQPKPRLVMTAKVHRKPKYPERFD